MTASSERAGTVHIVDDEAAVRDHVGRLARSAGWKAETYISAADFFKRYDGGRPGCIVMDLKMPEMSGLEALREAASRGILLPVIMITGYGDVATAVEGMQAGAVDFIEKPFRSRVLLDQIQRSIAMDAHNLRIQSASDRAHQVIGLLGQEELAVLELVADGKTDREIARSLSIAAKAVAGHRANVMRKLGVETLADLLSLYLHYLRSGPQKDRNG